MRALRTSLNTVETLTRRSSSSYISRAWCCGASQLIRPISSNARQPLQAPRPRNAAEKFSSSRTIYRCFTSSATRHENKRTPLYDLHVANGAKMGEFAGFDMPLEYKDQSHGESHKWTREHASLFDVSHMVQHKMSGELAEEFLSKVTPTAFDSLEKHTSTLSCLLSPDPPGGIVDDTVISRIGRDSFYFVTNAGCRDSDLSFIQSQMSEFLKSKDAAEDKIDWHVLGQHALLALQGPEAAKVLQNLVYADEDDASVDPDLSTLYFGQSRWLQLRIPEEDINTPSLLISRTGYTGEDGFEISIPPESGDSTGLATAIAKTLTADHDAVRWAGLAARDSLRLEAGMCLYGHDLNIDVTPPMAALGWVVPKSRRKPSESFNGASTVVDQLENPASLPRRRVGLTVEKGPAAREGAPIVHPDHPDQVVGVVTSGCPSPSLGGQNIAMGYVQHGWHKRGTKLAVKIRKNIKKAEVVRMPFVEAKFYRPQ